MTFCELIAPGPDRDRAVAQIREHLEALAGTLQPAVDALRALVASHEPVELISSIAIPTSLGFRAEGPSVDDATETVTWAAKIEYLVGVALSLPPGTGSTPTEVTDRVIHLLGDVFDAVRARHMVDSSRASTGNQDLDEALFMLRLEHLFDRMPGYAVHLEQIDAEVFDRHRQFYIDTLGFNPADVSRVVRRRNATQGARANAAMQRARRLINRDPPQAARATSEMLQALTDSRSWAPDAVADDTGIDVTEIARMLSFFSISFGSQPDFRLPTDENLARTRPCIDLGTGVYFIPDTWSLVAAVHDRLAKAAAGDPTGALQRYRRHREEGHQRLVAGALRRVFGQELVAENLHYTSQAGGPGEIDALVRVEWPLIVEAKAHGLTDPGRRGAPARVATVAGNVIKKALEQIRRAHTYIMDEGERAFSSRNGGHPVGQLPVRLSGVTDVVVTFERMDPLAMQGPAVVEEAQRPVWIVNIADLLMVVDILTDAGSFHHYARTRAATTAYGPVIYMESDGLGAYLVDRLATAHAKALEDPAATLILDYMSGDINEYFTATELEMKATKPTTGVPSSVADALSVTVGSSDGLWTRVADEVMTARPDTWKRWRSFSRRHRTGEFALSTDVALTVGSSALLTADEGETIQLRIPGRKSNRR